MAAALRHTARTLQRTQAAMVATVPSDVEVVRGRQLSQIIVRGGRSPASSSTRRFASASGSQNINAYDGIIDEKKKEVYSLLGEMHRSKTYTLTESNKQVLYRLSKQVGEDEWRWHRRAHLLKGNFFYALVFMNGLCAGKPKKDKDRTESSTIAR